MSELAPTRLPASRVALPEPFIGRLAAAPGYDELLDRAAMLVRADLVRPGHRHHLRAAAPTGPLEFVVSPDSRYDPPCLDLTAVLAALTLASRTTCEICAETGLARPAHGGHVLCAEHDVDYF